MVGMKACKYCNSAEHSSTFCFNAPKKPIKNSIKPRSKAIVGVSKPKVAKVSTTKKKKAKTRSQTVKELDAIFSQYIRLSESDINGYGDCVTCGERKFWKELQNGHFYTRGRYPTRWDEDNCHSQDYRCNVIFNGNYINYTRFMLDSYGREFVDELERKSLNGTKISTPELREKIAYYKQEVKWLLEEKHLI